MKHTPRILAVSLSVVAAALSVAAAPARALAAEAESDGIIVTMRQDAASEVLLLADATSALDAAGLDVTGVIDSADGELVLAADPAQGQTDDEALAVAQDLPGVESAQLNYVYHLVDLVPEDAAPAAADAPAAAPVDLTLAQAIAANDPFTQVSSPSVARNQYWAYASDLVTAWTLSTSDNVVTVVTLDSGAQLDHPDLKDNLIAEYAWDAARKKPLADDEVTDYNGHGTAVAGVISAVANNGVGLAGASYNANVLPIKILEGSGSGSNTEYLVNAFNYLLDLIDKGLVSNVRVVNMSLGTTADDTMLHELITRARDEYGIVTVCAGGNGNNVSPNIDPRTGEYRAHMYPGDYEECIAVTGLETDGTNLPYSDYNICKDISAPGKSIWSTWKGGDYSANSGTSLSAPIVSGTVALMFYAEPNATPDEVYEALCETAIPVIDPEHDRTVPDERGDVSGSHGALDAGAAVAYLKEHVTRFKDVTEADWHYNSVMFVGTRGIMNGYNDGQGNFGANDALTRQDAATLIYNLLGRGQGATDHGFADVEAGAYYQTAVNWCADQGIFKGYEDTGTFGVGKFITREELMCVVYNIAAEKGAQVDTGAFYELPDHASTSSWAVNASQWALSAGVIHGMSQPDGSLLLAPQNSTTRAEMAAIMMNSIKAGVLPDVA